VQLSEETGVCMTNSILVIEDSSEMQDLLKILLGQEDYDVRSAATATDALSILRDEFDFSLILLDLTLPDMSADTFLKRYKSLQRDHAVPIVFFSAVPRLKQMRLPEGVVGVIQKPFQIQEFLSVIKTFEQKPSRTSTKTIVEQHHHP